MTKQELIDVINKYPEHVVMEVLGTEYEDFVGYSFSSLNSSLNKSKDVLEWKMKIFEESENQSESTDQVNKSGDDEWA